MISVVLATYNGERFIEKQLLSILNQTCKPDEVFIADDCSKDNTAKLVQDFIKKNNLSNWNFEVNTSNQGYRKNFYNLLKKAQGDIIFLSDQDDEWYERKIEKMSKLMIDNSNIQALCCTVDLIDENSKKIELPTLPNLYNANFTFSERPLNYINYFDIKEIMANNISPGCSMCITGNLNKKFLETYNFAIPHDWHMTMLASMFNEGCCLLNESLIGYRLHENNVIGTTAGGGIREALRKFNRKEKIDEFNDRLNVLDALNEYFDVNSHDINYIREYTTSRLEFYKHPSLRTLRHLRTYREYWITSKRRGRMFDVLVAFHLDWILYLIYGEQR